MFVSVPRIAPLLISLALGLMLLGPITIATRADEPAAPRHLVLGSAHSSPIGLKIYCLRRPADCVGGGRDEVIMTKALMQLLENTNTAVNTSIQPLNDRGDVWSADVSSGDCEDYALTKRVHLIALGIPASALRIATALTPSGVGHAVLIVRSNSGDFVLDNRQAHVRDWHAANLKWIAISGADFRTWFEISL